VANKRNLAVQILMGGKNELAMQHQQWQKMKWTAQTPMVANNETGWTTLTAVNNETGLTKHRGQQKMKWAAKALTAASNKMGMGNASTKSGNK